VLNVVFNGGTYHVMDLFVPELSLHLFILMIYTLRSLLSSMVYFDVFHYLLKHHSWDTVTVQEDKTLKHFNWSYAEPCFAHQTNHSLQCLMPYIRTSIGNRK